MTMMMMMMMMMAMCRVGLGSDLQRRVGTGEPPSRRGVLSAPATWLRRARRVPAKTEAASTTHRHRYGQ